MSKLDCMQVAAALTQSVIGNLPDDLPRSKDGKVSTDIQAEDLLAWEVFRIFHHAVVAAVDEPSWPSPKAADVPAGGFDPTALLSNPVVKQLIDKLLPAVVPVVSPLLK